MKVMTHYRFWALSNAERKRWERRLLLQWNVPLEKVVQFEHLGPLIWSISEYVRDEAGHIVVLHNSATLKRRQLFQARASR